MDKSLKHSLEGIGLGLTAGLVIGISESDWLRMLIVIALFAYSIKGLQPTGDPKGSHSYRIAFLGLSCFLSILFGLFLQKQQIFTLSPQEEMAYWLKAGLTPAQAREQWLRQKAVKLSQIKADDSKGKTILQSFSTILGADSATTQSLSARLDSLQALITQHSTGEAPTTGTVDQIKEKVSKNLFSSSLSEKLCPRIDPDASINAEQYFEAIKNAEVEELNELTLKDTSIQAETRYALAKLLWDVVCTIESDKTKDWSKITDPEKKDAEEMEKIFQTQTNPAFGKVADWIKKNAKDKIAYYTKLHALIRRL